MTNAELEKAAQWCDNRAATRGNDLLVAALRAVAFELRSEVMRSVEILPLAMTPQDIEFLAAWQELERYVDERRWQYWGQPRGKGDL